MLLKAGNYANPKLEAEVHLLAYARDRLLISDRSLVIPFRNSACGGNARQKGTKVPSDRQEGELKGEIDGEKILFFELSPQDEEKEKLLLASVLSRIFSRSQDGPSFSESLIDGERERERKRERERENLLSL